MCPITFVARIGNCSAQTLVQERRKGRLTSTYLSLLSWTDQGIRTFRETIRRAAGAAERAQQYGASLQTYWPMGLRRRQHPRSPDDESATAFLSRSGLSGVVRTTTLRAYDHEDISGVHEGFGQQLFVGREEKVEAGALRPNSLFMPGCPRTHLP